MRVGGKRVGGGSASISELRCFPTRQLLTLSIDEIHDVFIWFSWAVADIALNLFLRTIFYRFASCCLASLWTHAIFHNFERRRVMSSECTYLYWLSLSFALVSISTWKFFNNPHEYIEQVEWDRGWWCGVWKIQPLTAYRIYVCQNVSIFESYRIRSFRSRTKENSSGNAMENFPPFLWNFIANYGRKICSTRALQIRVEKEKCFWNGISSSIFSAVWVTFLGLWHGYGRLLIIETLNLRVCIGFSRIKIFNIFALHFSWGLFLNHSTNL